MKLVQMKKIGKKAFIFKVIHFVIVVIVIILLVFLIQNDWNFSASVNKFMDFFG